MKKTAKSMRTALQFERLEDRLVPAGNVMVAVTVNTATHTTDLKITGDGSENAIAITKFTTLDHMDFWHIAGASDPSGVTTAVKLAPGTSGAWDASNAFVEIPVPATSAGGGFNNVTIDMGAAVTQPGRTRLTRGAVGVDSVSLNGIQILGNLSVTGTGGGLVNADLDTVSRNTTISFTGAGASSGTNPLDRVGSIINLTNSFFGQSTPTFGSLSITTGGNNDIVNVGVVANAAGQPTLDGNNHQILDGVAVFQDLTISTGGGDDIVRVKGTDGNGFKWDVRHNLTINTGDGNDLVDTSLIVGVYTPPAGIHPATLSGSESIDAGAGTDSVYVAGTVQQDLTVKLGEAAPKRNGVVPVQFAGLSVNVGGNTLVSGGAGNDCVTATGSFGSGVGSVVGSFGVLLGDGDNSLAMNNVTVAGNTAYLGGLGNDSVSATGSDAFLGSVSANLGDGNNVAMLTGINGIRVDGTTSISAGSGNDTVSLAGTLKSDVTVNVGDGTNAVSLLNVTAGVANPGFKAHQNLTTIAGGSGRDTVEISGSEQNVSLALGAGDNRLFVHDLSVAGGLSYKGLAGVDTIASDGVCNLGTLSLDLGDANNVVQLAPDGTHTPTVTTNSISILGGAGNNTISISGQSPSGLNVTLGAGDNVVTLNNVQSGRHIFSSNFNLSSFLESVIQMGAGYSQLQIVNSTFGADLSIKLDAGDHQVMLQNVSVATATTIKAKNGDSSVAISGASQFGTDTQGDPAASLDLNIQLGDPNRGSLGTGNNLIDVHPASVKGQLYVGTGAGRDVVNVSGQFGSLQTSLGDGDNVLKLGVDGAGNPADISVLGTTSLTLGKNEDDVTIGSLNSAHNARFNGDFTANLGEGDFNSLKVLGVLTQPDAVDPINNPPVPFALSHPTDPLDAADLNADVGKARSTTNFVKGFTVNGGTGEEALGFVGVLHTGNVTLNLGNGDNFVGISNVVVKGNVAITTGTGNDTVAIGSLHAGGDSAILGTVAINTGAGNDAVAVSGGVDNTVPANPVYHTVAFGGLVSINTGAGTDVLSADHATFYATTNVGTPPAQTSLVATGGASLAENDEILTDSASVRLAASSVVKFFRQASQFNPPHDPVADALALANHLAVVVADCFPDLA